MKCPDCAAPLVEQTRALVRVDQCDRCRSVWFDEGELQRYAERTRVRGSWLSALGEFVPARDRTRGECPRCGGDTLGNGTVDSVPVRRCRSCRGFYLTRQASVGLWRLHQTPAVARRVTLVEELGHMWLDWVEDREAIPLRPSELACPSCKQLLAEEVRAGIHVDRCEGCGGIWFDTGEVEAYAAATDRIRRPAELGRFVATSGGILDCPRCRTRTLAAGAIDSIPLARCDACAGVFVSRSALAQLVEALAGGSELSLIWIVLAIAYVLLRLWV